jgi:pyruvate ferredoxin oxidoreductase alpha subunit/oxalate oxidoreductase subunit alpha
MWQSRDVIVQATEEFGKIFGRKRDPFLELYQMDDAEMAIFIQGCHSVTAKYAIDEARKSGIKVGLVRPRFIRPFPTPEMEDVLGKLKAVGVVETNNSFGASGYAGQLTPEVCAAAVRAKSVPKLVSFFGGMGGHPIRISQFDYLIEKLAKAAKGTPEKEVHWLDLECEIEM